MLPALAAKKLTKASLVNSAKKAWDSKPLATALVAVGSFFVAKKVYNEARENFATRSTDIHTQIAQQMRDATQKLFGGDELILNVAKQGMDVSKTSKAYRNITAGRNMDADIRKKLNSNQYAQYLTYIRTNKTPDPVADNATASSYTNTTDRGKVVLIKSNTGAYADTDWRWYPMRARKRLNKGDVVQGATTGKYKTIDMGIFLPNPTFREVMVTLEDTSTRNVWIDNKESDVVTLADYEARYKTSYPNLVKFNINDF